MFFGFGGEMDSVDQYSNLSRRKIVLKKRKPNQEPQQITNDAVSIFKTESKPSETRTNPFKVTKTNQVASSTEAEEFCKPEFTNVIPATPEKDEPDSADFSDSLLAKRARPNPSKLSFEENTEPVASKEMHMSCLLPDFSISTRVRFLFPPGEASIEQINSFTNRVKENQHTALISFLQNDQVISKAGRLAELLNYYSYPDIPWLNLFPRKENRQLSQSESISVTAGISLKSRWDEAIDSVLAQISSSYKDSSAYILCDSFTILIHKCEKCGQVYSLLSPSTRGLRNALTQAGVKFKLPLNKGNYDTPENLPARSEENESEETTVKQYMVNTESTDQSDRTDVKDDVIEGQVDEEGEPLDWLESIGLDKENFPSLRAAKVQMDSESFRHIDYQPASTLLIEQCDLNKFIEFIKKFDRITATTGQLANIPPTILSRTPFRYAQLNSLQFSCGKYQLNSHEHMTYIDLSGPVLPNLSQTVVEYCLSDLSPDITVNFNKLPHSHVYNIHICSELNGNPLTIGNFSYKNQQYILDQQTLASV